MLLYLFCTIMFLLLLLIIFLVYILYNLVLFIYKLFVFLVHIVFVMLFLLIVMVYNSFNFLIVIVIILLAGINFYKTFITPLFWACGSEWVTIYNYFSDVYCENFMGDFIISIFYSIGLALFIILSFYFLEVIYIVWGYCCGYFSSNKGIVYYSNSKFVLCSFKRFLCNGRSSDDFVGEGFILCDKSPEAEEKAKYIEIFWNFLGKNKPCKLDFIIEGEQYRIWKTPELLEKVKEIDRLVWAKLDLSYREVVFKQVFIAGTIVYHYIVLHREDSISAEGFFDLYMYIFRKVFFKRAHDSGRLFYEVDWSDPDIFNFDLWLKMVDDLVKEDDTSVLAFIKGSTFHYRMPFSFDYELKKTAYEDFEDEVTGKVDMEKVFIKVYDDETDLVVLEKTFKDLEVIKKVVNLEIKRFNLWEGRCSSIFYYKCRDFIITDKWTWDWSQDKKVYNEWVEEMTLGKDCKPIFEAVKESDILFIAGLSGEEDE